MAHDPKTHPTTRTSPAVALQLPPSPAQGVSMPVAGQKPPCRGSQASSATQAPPDPTGTHAASSDTGHRHAATSSSTWGSCPLTQGGG